MHPKITYDYPSYYLEGQPFQPNIFDGSSMDLPTGFDSYLIKLEGRMDSDLRWDLQLKQALELNERGVFVLYYLDLGLFDNLTQPLEDEAQWRSLKLAVDHFVEWFWPQVMENCLGLCIYRGKNTSDLSLPYLNQLVVRVPFALPLVLCLDETEIQTDAERLFLASRCRFERYVLALTHSHREMRQLAWTPGEHIVGNKEDENIKEAICLPDTTRCTPDFISQINSLIEQIKLPYRVISEEFITAEWDGLDRMYAPVSLFTDDGVRMLKGFEAAGGEVLNI